MAADLRTGTLVVLEPTTEPIPTEVSLAPRLDSLEGKVVGLLDNSKLNADRFLDLMERELTARYRLGGVVRARKPNAGRPCPEEIAADLAARCDAVITAIGD